MKKNVLFSILVLVVVLASILAACTKPTPTTPVQPTTPSTPTATTPPKPIEIIAQHSNPPTGGQAQCFQRFADRIEQQSNGRVKFTIYWSSGLMPSPEIVKGVDSGALHVGYTGGPIANYWPMSWYPFNLPFMGVPSMDAGKKIFLELWDTTPEVRDEWKGFIPLSLQPMPPQQIHSAKSPIKVPNDVKGHKVCITSAGPMSKLVSALGGAPIVILPPELSQSLTSGVVDSFFDHFPVCQAFGTIPLFKNHTIIGQRDDQGIAYGTHSIFMKESFFNSLPADIQKIFQDSAEIYGKETIEVDRDQEIARAMKEAKDLNHPITYLTPQEVQLWQKAAEFTHEDWIKEYEAKGKPARMIYDKMKQLIKKYSQ